MGNKKIDLLLFVGTVCLVLVGLVLIYLDYRNALAITYTSFLPILSLLISGGLFLNSYLRKSRK